MQIKSTLKNRSGQVLDVIYNDLESEADIGNRDVKAVYAYCFYKDKLVVVYVENRRYWSPPGGSVESGESISEAVVREVMEEANMRVLRQRIIGYHDISEPLGVVTQTRSVCVVEPNGPFVSDPDGDITEIKLIDPRDYKKYFDWGEIGDHIMARALKLKAEIDEDCG